MLTYTLHGQETIQAKAGQFTIEITEKKIKRKRVVFLRVTDPTPFVYSLECDLVTEAMREAETYLARVWKPTPITLDGKSLDGTKNYQMEFNRESKKDGASVFHKGIIPIPELKAYLRSEGVQIRD